MPPLLSGNGRHRRPRQAPNFVVAAGVTGAGLALPLLGATSASAADNTTWDAVAECESGGLWSADENNGAYGGLQLDQETWEEHGGTEYAGRPDLASRDQQITVAERLLDAEGAESFGECAESAGLSQDSPGDPDVDPDGSDDVADGPVAERPYPTEPSESGDATDDDGATDGDASADPSESPDPSQSPDPSESGSGSGSGDDTSDSPDAPESPDATAPSVPDGSGDGSGSGEESGHDDGTYDPGGPAGHGNGGDSADGSDEHPSRGGADGRDDAGNGKGGDDGRYRVSHGDSLSAIADEENVRGGWQRLYEHNRDVVGSDPDLILPGQELRL
ncbi:LysM domain-containing protein [Streptomyces sp. Amel2xB2]|uniref:LysM peptidoglycan-binding domain-containing protein n=1 Tax=Streptomyces sp. Amel2xB2 TaxID=1305829 RepID=UPI000DBFF289|nr:transglycosylase family protein [Streptomyces sp. Amel2xB2]RAJ62527.1 LysM domain-containing protein [Streptomyces sp. Amel2xB2]